MTLCCVLRSATQPIKVGVGQLFAHDGTVLDVNDPVGESQEPSVVCHDQDGPVSRRNCRRRGAPFCSGNLKTRRDMPRTQYAPEVSTFGPNVRRLNSTPIELLGTGDVVPL